MQRRTFLTTATAAGMAATMARSQAAPYQLPEQYMPRYVRIAGDVPAGEILVLPREFALLWTLPDQRAIRYSVGIGKPGLYEDGEFYVGAKKEWPDWTPTPAMIKREPEIYTQFEDGMPGGPGNPLGARALYLFQEGRGDTMLRIHGTSDPTGIGHEVSNGCARLLNAHAVDLYERVPIGARVVLYPKT